MELQEFVIEVRNRVSEQLGSDYDVLARKVIKNNSVEYDCLSITYKNNIVSPSIYLKSYYQQWVGGRSIEDITKNIIDVYNDSIKNLDRGWNSCIDTENANEKVILRLVNYSKNQKILEKCPHDRIGDFAVTYHYLVANNEKDGLATARIDYNNISYFGLEEKELRNLALKNTERLFPPIFEGLDNIFRKFTEKYFNCCFTSVQTEDHAQMYLLTNTEKLNGAACILYKGLLDRIRKVLGKNFYVIPSSINEVLILPDSPELCRCSLEEMVREVNKESVPETEVLSDKVYYYPDDRDILVWDI